MAVSENELKEQWAARTIALIGEDAFGHLSRARVLVAGVGGVGGYAAEILVRSGVGNVTIADFDTVAISNLNRQLIALSDTVGESKTRLFAERFRKINPACRVTAVDSFITEENIAELLSSGFDYVIDAIDTIAPKCALILGCKERGIPVISSMGAGGRLDPAKIIYSDLWHTREDGLARAVRQRFKKNGIHPSLRVVCSTEAPRKGSVVAAESRNKLTSAGTLASVPAIFGIYLANYVILKISGLK